MDLDGFEPSTSSMPWKRAPNCATGPCLLFDVLRIAHPSTIGVTLQFIDPGRQNLVESAIDSGADRDHNQTVGYHLNNSIEAALKSMNNVVPPVSALRAGHPNSQSQQMTGVNPVNLEELAHELRQPLSTIESLAYYLEITSGDDQVCRYLEQIRMLVTRANGILDHAIVA